MESLLGDLSDATSYSTAASNGEAAASALEKGDILGAAGSAAQALSDAEKGDFY